jgi:hypothetical protein
MTMQKYAPRITTDNVLSNDNRVRGVAPTTTQDGKQRITIRKRLLCTATTVPKRRNWRLHLLCWFARNEGRPWNPQQHALFFPTTHWHSWQFKNDTEVLPQCEHVLVVGPTTTTGTNNPSHFLLVRRDVDLSKKMFVEAYNYIIPPQAISAELFSSSAELSSSSIH